MKKYFVAALSAAIVMGASCLYAEPQRIQIKSADQAASEKMAITQIKSIDLESIEDPAARRAIQEILNFLGLSSQSFEDVEK